MITKSNISKVLVLLFLIGSYDSAFSSRVSSSRSAPAPAPAPAPASTQPEISEDVFKREFKSYMTKITKCKDKVNKAHTKFLQESDSENKRDMELELRTVINKAVKDLNKILKTLKEGIKKKKTNKNYTNGKAFVEKELASIEALRPKNASV